MRYWAKTTPDGLPGIDVDQHLLRVGFVAKWLAKLRRSQLAYYELHEGSVSCLASGHDLGKISEGFQSKCPAWLEKNGLLEESARWGWHNFEKDHGKIGQFTLQRLLTEPEFGLKRSSANWWAAAVGCHHGRLHYPGERGLRSGCGMSVDRWEEERRNTALCIFEALKENYESSFSLPAVTPQSPELWWVAGLTSVADWIGSDEAFFPADEDLSASEISERASRAVEAIGLGLPSVRAGLSFTDIFPFSPNALQTVAMEVIRSPGIYVVEAPMGTGKTEAALAVAYELLCSDMATGIYFALPTQATSNRIHKRLDDFVQRICPCSSSARLIHSNSWLMENLAQPKPTRTSGHEEDARRCRDWLASSKRALLAPFGVGTVDQALLSIVAAKHFFVRRFALAGKVVIIDEVHSYDVYTGTLIGKLCEALNGMGCTVILLSATLTRERRFSLLQTNAAPEGQGGVDPYPLVSSRSGEVEVISHSVPRSGIEPKDVVLRFPPETEALKAAVDRARSGACILWICDTVNKSQRIFRFLKEMTNDQFDIGLLHARFPFFIRQNLEDRWMAALGKEDGVRPDGCILISTQIVEQSVDLDADLMITELAPTDMLLQRMGRLWRHQRSRRPVHAPECWIVREERTLEELKGLDADELKKVLGPKGKVYAPYVLLRSLEVWTEQQAQRQSIAIPDEIRDILERTYSDSDDLPQGWLALKDEILGDLYAERMMADMNSNFFNLALPDDEGVQTRLNAFETVSLILAREVGKNGSVVLLDGEPVQLGREDFSLKTARALHRNLVRVPEWVFDAFQSTEATANYVRGKQSLVSVDGGEILASGLKPQVKLYWSEDAGIEIMNKNGGMR